MFKITYFITLLYLNLNKRNFELNQLNNIDKGESPRPRGVNIRTKAPMINTVDIYGKPINLNNLLRTYDGVMLDFFRGNW